MKEENYYLRKRVQGSGGRWVDLKQNPYWKANYMGYVSYAGFKVYWPQYRLLCFFRKIYVYLILLIWVIYTYNIKILLGGILTTRAKMV